MLRAIIWSVIIAFVLVVLFALPLPPAQPHGPLLAGAEAPHQVTAVLERACQDCHSNNTRWPWYARVAPLRWYITRDVERARRAMNLSTWDQYSPERQRLLLARMTDLTRLHQMPPPAYIFGHVSVVMNDEESKAIEQWARRELDRMKEQAAR